MKQRGAVGQATLAAQAQVASPLRAFPNETRNRADVWIWSRPPIFARNTWWGQNYWIIVTKTLLSHASMLIFKVFHLFVLKKKKLL